MGRYIKAIVEIDYTSRNGNVYRVIGYCWNSGERQRTHTDNGDPADVAENEGFASVKIVIPGSYIDLAYDLIETEDMIDALTQKAREDD